MKPLSLAVFVTIIVASIICACGCTSSSNTATSGSSTPSTIDYSNYYNKAWGERVIETPFYQTTSARGNPLYVGVIRNASTQVTYTVTFELLSSLSEAAQLFKNTVASAKADGYITRAFKTPDPYSNERWQGDRGYSYLYTRYYYEPDVNAWEFMKEYG